MSEHSATSSGKPEGLLQALRAQSHVLDFCVRAFSRFYSHNGMITAAGLTYFAFLSLPPLALLVISVASLFLGDTDSAREFVRDAASQAFPSQAAALADQVHALIESRGTVGIIGLAGLLIAGPAFFRMAEYAVNGLWGQETPRSFLPRALVDIGLTVSTVVLAGGSFVGTLMYRWAADWFTLPPLAQVVGWFSGVLCAVVGLYAIYTWLPVAKTPPKAVIITAVAVVAVLELLKPVYGLYIDRFSAYDSMYGPIGDIAISMVYMYLVLIIFLLGAAALAEVDSFRRREP